jgi:cupin 2 domain-containing protein
MNNDNINSQFKITNIFNIPNVELKEEIIEIIHKNENTTIERIISTGQTTPEDYWYDQEKDEIVFLFQGNAKLLFEDETIIELQKGDYITIKAHQKHKVVYTSNDPPCVWLAIHGNFN